MSAPTAEKPAVLGARFGLYAGLASLILLITLYCTNALYLISPVVFTGFIAVVVAKVMAGYILWKNRGGQVEFKAALQSIFMVSVVSLAIIVFFFYLLFNFIDPSLTVQIRGNIERNAMKAFEENAITKEQLTAAQDRAQRFRLGAGEFFAAYSFTLFVGFFYAVVLAGITRLIGREISDQSAARNN